MKIKIGDKIIDPHEEPIMLIFDDLGDREIIIKHLTNMVSKATKYCIYPDNMSSKEITKFMKTD